MCIRDSCRMCRRECWKYRVAERIRPDQERGDRELAGRGKKDEAPRRKRASQFVLRGRHDAFTPVRLTARARRLAAVNDSASIARKWPRNECLVISRASNYRVLTDWLSIAVESVS